MKGAPLFWRAFLSTGLSICIACACLSMTVILETEGVASADPIADCSTTIGEIVVVDFSHWGGSIVRGCDATLTTGYNALSEAGFITAGTEDDGPAFICRIGIATEGSSSYEPPPSEDPCVNTPPATAYWSYWHADAGQNTWTYSQQGAMTYQPPPGSVDAWVFGATNLSGTTGGPSFPPSEVRATNTSPSAPPTTVTSSQPGTSSTTSTSARDPLQSTTTPISSRHVGTESNSPPTSTSQLSRSGAATSTSTTGPRTSGSRGAGTSSFASGTTASTQAQKEKIVTLGPSAVGGPTQTGNSPLSFEIGAGVAGVVGVAGGLVAWRRRHNRNYG